MQPPVRFPPAILMRTATRKSTEQANPRLRPTDSVVRGALLHTGWPDGGVVTQRTANPCTPVRFRLGPPFSRAGHPIRHHAKRCGLAACHQRSTLRWISPVISCLPRSGERAWPRPVGALTWSSPVIAPLARSPRSPAAPPPLLRAPCTRSAACPVHTARQVVSGRVHPAPQKPENRHGENPHTPS